MNAGIIGGIRASKTDMSFLTRAVGLASESSCRMKHGAVVVKSGRVLGTGYNKMRNIPSNVGDKYFDEYCSVHAEVDALKSVKKSHGATIYVARINNQGERRLSKPCESCQAYLDKRGIKRVIYTTGG